MKYVHAVVLIGFLSATVSAEDDAPVERQLADRRSAYLQWTADTFGKLEPTMDVRDGRRWDGKAIDSDEDKAWPTTWPAGDSGGFHDYWYSCYLTFQQGNL